MPDTNSLMAEVIATPFWEDGGGVVMLRCPRDCGASWAVVRPLDPMSLRPSLLAHLIGHNYTEALGPQAQPHGELCGARALGCGPCQLFKGHELPNRHLCDHYAKGGVELHDPSDSGCRCPDCLDKRAKDQLRIAEENHAQSEAALAEAKRRFLSRRVRP